MEKIKQEKTYLEPRCELTLINSCGPLCQSLNQGGTIDNPFTGSTETMW